MTEAPVCPECIAEGVKARRAVAKGATRSRCTTHWRLIKRARRSQNHDRYVQRQYGLRPGEYDKLKESQGGRCGICQVSTGAARALALEHDHGHCAVCATGACCGAPEAIRGLACSICNEIIGRLPAEALVRAARWLLSPPGTAVIRALRAGTDQG